MADPTTPLQAPTQVPHAGRIPRGQLIAVAVSSALLWVVLGGTPLLLPVELLVTLVHEAAHALTAMVLGADVLSVTVNSRGGGLMHYRGDLSTARVLAVTSAGYVGTALVGAVMLEMSAWIRSGRAALGLLAALIAAIGLAWVPWRTEPDGIAAIASGSGSGDGRFTVLVCVVAVVVFAVLVVQPSRPLRRFLVVFLATCLCLGAVQSLQLVRDISRAGGHSDAAIAASMSPLSSWMWSTIWLVVGVGLCTMGAWSLASRTDPLHSRRSPADRSAKNKEQ